MLNIRQLGAVGDGETLETTTIQNAIDLAAKEGKTLLFPPGIYKTGTLFLRSGTSIELQENAVIQASDNIDDYVEDIAKIKKSLRFYLFWAKDASDVAIRGKGLIDGAGRAFWQDISFSGTHIDNFPPLGPLHYEVLKPKDKRPCVIYCENTTNITLDGFTIRHSPSYTVWLLGCSNAMIQNLTIRNQRFGPNTDALDIDCSDNVTIQNCDIDAGDDCVAIKSDAHRLGKAKPCENIIVKNCKFVTATCAIRVGYEGDAPIRNCTFSNLDIQDTRHAIDIISIAPGELPFTKIVTGTPISDLTFENIKLTNVAKAIFCWAGNVEGVDTYNSSITNIRFKNIKGDVLESSSFISARTDCAITDITLEDISLTLDRTLPSIGDDFIPSHWGGQSFNALMTIKNAGNFTFKNVLLNTKSNPALRVIKVKSLNLIH